MNCRRFFAKLVRRTVQALRIDYYRVISDNRPKQERLHLIQPLFCTGSGSIVLTDCHIGVQPSPGLWNSYCHVEAREHSATIHIGPDVWLNNGAVLIAERTDISIDSGCLIGPGVQIFDSDFHDVNPFRRMSGQHECAPVHIQENVFIGASVMILKGVTIGRNSVVAAGSVVVTSVPENSIVAGIPARVVRGLASGL